MPKLFSSEQAVKVLRRKGFVFISQKGSHAKFRKKTFRKTLTVIAPMDKKEIPRGTFKSILRQAELREEDFINA